MDEGEEETGEPPTVSSTEVRPAVDLAAAKTAPESLQDPNSTSADEDVPVDITSEHPEKQMVNEKAMYIGNLVTDMKISLLKEKLVDLLNSIKPLPPIRKNHINVVCKPQTAYAFVFLETSDEASMLITALISAVNADERFAAPITSPGSTIKCGPMFKKSIKHKHKTTAARVASSSKRDQFEKSSAADEVTEQPPPAVDPGIFKYTHTESKSESRLIPRPNEKFPMHRLFYKAGEIVGAETRFLEFKQGRGSYLDKQLREHVARYTCGFLNSEGGTLLIGIRDSGLVEGVTCDHAQEDQYRLHIDGVIKMISPTIFSHMYDVYFAPVLDKECNAIKNVKVIEVSVVAGASDRLYETPEGHVFMRRDGSLQGPLQARHIQEWTRCKILQEQQTKEAEVKQALKIEQSKEPQESSDSKFWQEEILKYRQREEELRAQVIQRTQQEESLRRKLSAVMRERDRLSHHKSKVCTII